MNTGTTNKIDPQENGCKLKWFYDEYTFLTTEAAGDVIKLLGIDLPIGARIVDWVIDHGDLANNRTLALGTLASAAGLMTATDCGAAADKKNMNDHGVTLTLGYEIDEANDQVVILTLGGGAAAAVKVQVGILVAMPA
jgi:hypothetical protein